MNSRVIKHTAEEPESQGWEDKVRLQRGIHELTGAWTSIPIIPAVQVEDYWFRKSHHENGHDFELRGLHLL